MDYFRKSLNRLKIVTVVTILRRFLSLNFSQSFCYYSFYYYFQSTIIFALPLLLLLVVLLVGKKFDRIWGKVYSLRLLSIEKKFKDLLKLERKKMKKKERFKLKDSIIVRTIRIIVKEVGPTTTVASIIMGLVVGLMTIELGYVALGGLAGLTAGILFVIPLAQLDGKDSPWPPIGFCLIYILVFLLHG